MPWYAQLQILKKLEIRPSTVPLHFKNFHEFLKTLGVRKIHLSNRAVNFNV